MNRAIVLASTSPRRQMLLKEVCETFTVCPPNLAEEKLNPALPLPQALEKLALEKASSVAESYPEAYVIGADTIVCKEGQCLGKPASPEDAAHMLRALSAATHEVITAVAVVCQRSGQVQTGHCVSRVTFRSLTEADISAYIETGEPLDKAGAYGIQGRGGAFVAALEGAFDNVVGLPTALVRKLLAACEEDGPCQKK